MVSYAMGWLQIHCVAKFGLKTPDPPASTPQVLVLMVCTTIAQLS